MNRLLAVASVALLLSSNAAVRGQVKARPLAIEESPRPDSSELPVTSCQLEAGYWELVTDA